MAWGDADGRTLFLAAGSTLYRTAAQDRRHTSIAGLSEPRAAGKAARASAVRYSGRVPVRPFRTVRHKPREGFCDGHSHVLLAMFLHACIVRKYRLQ